MTDETSADLRSRLFALAVDKRIDPGKLVELATAVAREDPNRAWFSIDAGLIDRLGLELVARQETAVAELIKNAYDADALKVDVTFVDCFEPRGTLIIEDDGDGMTRDELINGFMRLSTTHKVRQPRSPRLKRERAGKKGIGRFAVQRIGKRLKLTTQTEGATEALVLEVDWSQFQPDRELGTIACSLLSGPPRKAGRGTTIEIQDVRDAWTDAQIRRTHRYVTELLRPGWNGVHQPDGSAASKPDSFDVDFYWTREDQDIEVLDFDAILRESAVAEVVLNVVAGKVEAKLHLLKVAPGTEERLPLDGTEAAGLDGVKLRAFYFIQVSDYVSKLNRRFLADFLRHYGGVRFFRNGFRVPPYGGKDDDWLGLDFSQQQRGILVPHNNQAFYGHVEASDPDGRLFPETSSREGVLETLAFVTLRKLCFGALTEAAIRVGNSRTRKTKASGPSTSRSAAADSLRGAGQDVRGIAAEAEQAAQAINNLPLPPEEKRQVVETATHLKQLADDLATRVEAEADVEEARSTALLEEVDALRVLASLGMLVGEFAHEIRHILNALIADSLRLGEFGPTMEPAKAASVAARLRSNIDGLRSLATYFDQAMADRAQRQIHPVDVRATAQSFAQMVRRRLEASKIELTVQAAGFDLLSRPMHASEWTSILFNFLTNAEKAIKRARVKGRLLIEVVRDGAELALRFADNGVGIPEQDRERVFEPFFTTSTQFGEAPDGTVVSGTGLGLKIVRDIVAARNGSVELVAPAEGYRTCFEVRVPAQGGNNV
jgi:signal transduction histidine kinase